LLNTNTRQNRELYNQIRKEAWRFIERRRERQIEDTKSEQ